MNLQESGEMYLETILRLSQKMDKVRSIDIADEMGYSKPSISRAMRILKENGFVSIDSLGAVTLTEKGRASAEKTYERHQVLTSLFIGLGVNETVAADDACKIEHVISDETFEAMKKHIVQMKGVNSEE
ncbi:MAG: metal-dependent transcriptional regulator [Clostridia bacterium]|nr:metal-dependent transcriptional regulator [Clostridia bacterium]